MKSSGKREYNPRAPENYIRQRLEEAKDHEKELMVDESFSKDKNKLNQARVKAKMQVGQWYQRLAEQSRETRYRGSHNMSDAPHYAQLAANHYADAANFAEQRMPTNTKIIDSLREKSAQMYDFAAESYGPKPGEQGRRVQEEYQRNAKRLRETARHDRSIEKKVSAALAIGGLALSLIALSPNLTGRTIFSVSSISLKNTSVIFFLIGLVAALFYFNSK